MDYYGRKLATCSSDHSVKVYEVTGDSYKLISDLKGYVYYIIDSTVYIYIEQIPTKYFLYFLHYFFGHKIYHIIQ